MSTGRRYSGHASQRWHNDDGDDYANVSAAEVTWPTGSWQPGRHIESGGQCMTNELVRLTGSTGLLISHWLTDSTSCCSPVKSSSHYMQLHAWQMAGTYSYTYNGRPIESRMWFIDGAIFNDLERPLPQFQGHTILWRWISQKRYDIQTYCHRNTNRDLRTPYATVTFRMTLSDLEWLSKIFSDTKRRAVSLWQLSFLSNKFSNEVILVILCVHDSITFSIAGIYGMAWIMATMVLYRPTVQLTEYRKEHSPKSRD